LQEFAVDGDFDSILMSLFGILFPAAGCSTIANGALMAVFNERASRMQKRHEENFMLFGRIQSKFCTPEAMRGFGAIILQSSLLAAFQD